MDGKNFNREQSIQRTYCRICGNLKEGNVCRQCDKQLQIKFCSTCGSKLVEGKCLNCELKNGDNKHSFFNSIKKNKVIAIPILIVTLIIFGYFITLLQHDRVVKANIHSIMDSNNVAFIASKTKKEDIASKSKILKKLKLSSNKKKMSREIEVMEEKFDITEKLNAIYLSPVIDGSSINYNVGTKGEASTLELAKIREDNKKIKADDFTREVNEIIKMSESRLRKIKRIRDRIDELMTDSRVENNEVGEEADKIRELISEIKVKSEKASLIKLLENELSTEDSKREELEQTKRRDEIQSLSDVTEAEDIEWYNSDITPARIALYVYFDIKEVKGRRTVYSDGWENGSALGEIRDSEGTVYRYWDMTSDCRLRFYKTSDRDVTKEGPFDLSDIDEDELIEFIDTLN